MKTIELIKKWFELMLIDNHVAMGGSKPIKEEVDETTEEYISELTAYKDLVHTMFTGWFNANDYFAYACAWGVNIMEEDFYWIVKHIQKHPKEGMYACMAYIQNNEPIKPYLNDEFIKAVKELVDRKQEVLSDTDYSNEYTKEGPYRTINFD